MAEAETSGRTGKGHYILLLAAGLLLAVYAWAFISPDLADLSGDSARYLLLARALAAGPGYVESWVPGAPAHTEFAPGLPLLIAPLTHLFPSTLVPAKIVIYLFLAGTVLAFHQLARAESFSRTRAAGLALVLAGMPYLSRFANQVLADLPYAALSMAGLVLAVRGLGRGRAGPAHWFWTGLVMALAFLFRQTALALWSAALLGIFFHGQFSGRQRLNAALFLALGFALPAGWWLARNYLAAGALDPSHWDKLFAARASDPLAGDIGLAGLAARTARGLMSYIGMVPWAVFDLAWPQRPRAAGLAITALVIAPAAVSWGARMASRRGPLEWYLVLYLLMISVWQSHYLRYLVPVVPVILFYWADGLERLLGLAFRLPGRQDLVPRALAVVLSIAAAANLAVFVGDLGWINRAPVTPAVRSGAAVLEDEEGRRLADLAGVIHWGYWHQYPDLRRARDPVRAAERRHRLLAAASWLRSGLDGDAVVMARKPTLVSYYSGRRSVQYFAELEPEAFWRSCREAGVRYFLVDEVSLDVRSVFGSHLKALEDGRLGFRSGFVVVFSIGDTMVIDTPGIGE